MSGCENIPRIGAYHDGELSDAGRDELERHILICDDCRRELRRLEALSQWLASAPRPEVPVEVLERLRVSIRPGRERTLLRMAGSLTAAAAAVLIACSAVLWQRWSATAGPLTADWGRTALIATSPQPEGPEIGSEAAAEPDVDVELIKSILGVATGGNGYEHE